MEADVIAAMVFLGISIVGFGVHFIFYDRPWSFAGMSIGGMFAGLTFARLIDVLTAVQNLPC